MVRAELLDRAGLVGLLAVQFSLDALARVAPLQVPREEGHEEGDLEHEVEEDAQSGEAAKGAQRRQRGKHACQEGDDVRGAGHQNGRPRLSDCLGDALFHRQLLIARLLVVGPVQVLGDDKGVVDADSQ